MKDRRGEFQSAKQKILKSLGRKTTICARCGLRGNGTHFHHLKAVVSGGTDDATNLIPLCGDCHLEWDVYESAGLDFGEFLITIPVAGFAAMYKCCAFRIPPSAGMNFKTFHAMVWTGSSIRAAREDGDGRYWDELHEENKVFTAYPYSDTEEMFRLYGKIYEPVTSEEEAARAIMEVGVS